MNKVLGGGGANYVSRQGQTQQSSHNLACHHIKPDDHKMDGYAQAIVKKEKSHKCNYGFYAVHTSWWIDMQLGRWTAGWMDRLIEDKRFHVTHPNTRSPVGDI